MAKKKKNQNQNQSKPKSLQITLREEKTGKKHADVASILRIKHLTRVATWANGEGRVKPLGSTLGQLLCAAAESAGLPLDSASVLCQRCETILLPGSNCTIRIKKNRNKIKKCQNNVVYTCHFCRHDNSRWGTAKGTVQSLFASKSGLHAPSEERETKIPMTPVSNKTAINLTKNGKNDFGSISVNSASGNGNNSRKKRKGWTSLKEKTQNQRGLII